MIKSSPWQKEASDLSQILKREVSHWTRRTENEGRILADLGKALYTSTLTAGGEPKGGSLLFSLIVGLSDWDAPAAQGGIFEKGPSALIKKAVQTYLDTFFSKTDPSAFALIEHLTNAALIAALILGTSSSLSGKNSISIGSKSDKERGGIFFSALTLNFLESSALFQSLASSLIEATTPDLREKTLASHVLSLLALGFYLLGASGGDKVIFSELLDEVSKKHLKTLSSLADYIEADPEKNRPTLLFIQRCQEEWERNHSKEFAAFISGQAEEAIAPWSEIEKELKNSRVFFDKLWFSLKRGSEQQEDSKTTLIQSV